MTDDRPADALATALSASAASERTAAAEALQARADRDPAAVASVAPDLAAGLTDVDGAVRTATTAAVADAADADPAAVGALAGHLADRVADDDHLAVRHHAAYALARVGETDPVTAQRALPALVDALAAADDALRRLATLAVAAVADADPSVVADELATADPGEDESGDEEGERVAESPGGGAVDGDDESDATTTGAIDPETLATRLASAVADEDATVRRRASRALARLVEADAGVLPVPDPEAIRTALVADAAVVRRDAAFLLARAAATAPESVPDDETLVTDLRDRLSDHGAVAVHAAAALSDLADHRPAAVAPAVPDLATAATHDRPDVRANATLALGRLATTAPGRVAETIETLTELVTADAAVVRANAAFALSRLADADPEAARPAMEPLLARLEDDTETDAVRGHAGTALDTLRSELSPGATLGPPGDDADEIPRGAAAVSNGRGVADAPGGTGPNPAAEPTRGDDSGEYARGAPTSGSGDAEHDAAEPAEAATTPVDSDTPTDAVDPDTPTDAVDPDTPTDDAADAADADTTDPSEFDEAVAFGDDAAFDAEGEFVEEGEFAEEARFETDDGDAFGDDGGEAATESADDETRAAEAGFADEGAEDVFDGPDVTPFASESTDTTAQGDGDDTEDRPSRGDAADED